MVGGDSGNLIWLQAGVSIVVTLDHPFSIFSACFAGCVCRRTWTTTLVVTCKTMFSSWSALSAVFSVDGRRYFGRLNTDRFKPSHLRYNSAVFLLVGDLINFDIKQHQYSSSYWVLFYIKFSWSWKRSFFVFCCLILIMPRYRVLTAPLSHVKICHKITNLKINCLSYYLHNDKLFISILNNYILFELFNILQ